MTSAWWILQLFYCEIPFLISAIAATTTSHLTNNKKQKSNRNATYRSLLNFESAGQIFCFCWPNEMNKNQQQKKNRRLLAVATAASASDVRGICVWVCCAVILRNLCGHPTTSLTLSQTHENRKKKIFSLFFSISMVQTCGSCCFCFCLQNNSNVSAIPFEFSCNLFLLFSWFIFFFLSSFRLNSFWRFRFLIDSKQYFFFLLFYSKRCWNCQTHIYTPRTTLEFLLVYRVFTFFFFLYKIFFFPQRLSSIQCVLVVLIQSFHLIGCCLLQINYIFDW